MQHVIDVNNITTQKNIAMEIKHYWGTKVALEYAQNLQRAGKITLANKEKIENSIAFDNTK